MNHPDSEFCNESTVNHTTIDAIQMQSVLYPDISIQIPVEMIGPKKVREVQETTDGLTESENLRTLTQMKN